MCVLLDCARRKDTNGTAQNFACIAIGVSDEDFQARAEPKGA
jgi:hypothetical protein